MVFGDAVRDAGVANLSLRADNSLGDGGLIGKEGSGDFGGGETAEGPQSERDAGFHGQGGVAGREDKPQAVIAEGLGVEIEFVFGEGRHRSGDLR